jgi:hypothetical protein
MSNGRRRRVLVVVVAAVLGGGVATAQPGQGSATVKPAEKKPAEKPRFGFRWQVVDGTTFGFRLVAPAEATPKLEVSYQGEDYDLPLTGATKDLSPVVFARGEDLIVSSESTPGLAWRLSIIKGRFAIAKTATWKTAKAQPAWAKLPASKTPRDALTQLATLLRFGGSVAGLERYFTDVAVAWNVFKRGTAEPYKRSMPGTAVISTWDGAGYPIVRGTIKVQGRCATLPANAASKPAAAAAPPEAPHLLRLCLDADLHVTELDTLIVAGDTETIVTP